MSELATPIENYLAIDYGRKRIGLALTRSAGIAITNLGVLESQNSKCWQQLYEVIENNGIEKVIVGNPAPLDGSKSTMQVEIDNFITHLKKKFQNIEFVLWDESFTSQMAESTMRLTQGKSHTSKSARQKQKARQDSLAAHFILRSYLDNNV